MAVTLMQKGERHGQFGPVGAVTPVFTSVREMKVSANVSSVLTSKTVLVSGDSGAG